MCIFDCCGCSGARNQGQAAKQASSTPPSSPVQSCPGGQIQQRLGISDTEFRDKCRQCAQVANDGIQWARKMQNEYRQTLNDPANVTGDDVENAVDSSLASQGITTSTAGTTDSQGNVTVQRQPGPCGRLKELSTEDHENVHARYQQDLERQHGRNTPAFRRAWNNANNWVNDEVNAYQANIDFWNQFKQECQACGP